uniref:DH domain-containing protein n=1 Tax=Mesocestoides corti TaxID=53468 RepID=A0A5K3FPP2_MESCO
MLALFLIGCLVKALFTSLMPTICLTRVSNPNQLFFLQFPNLNRALFLFSPISINASSLPRCESRLVQITGTHGGTGDDTAAKSSIPVAQDHRSTRQNILLEFVESERQYYRDLFEVKEKIYEGLKKQNVGEKKLSQIFCNWATLCDISEAFNKDFQERKRLIAKNPNELIGDILVRHLPKCMVYRDFCANQDVALSRLEKLCEENPDVASFLQSCQRLMRVRAMPLSSYFLKPMQRITKYKLLIEKLLKHTQPTHPDRANLEQSLELASTILDVCNEAIRNRENFVQLQWLQDHVAFASRDEEISFVGDELLSPFFGSRRLILSGTLFKVKSKKELTAFLFNDMLFLTQPINFSATTLPTGNFTLPLKPDASLKVFFRAYRKPLSTANIRVSETVLSRPRRRSAWIGGLSQASASDLSTVGVAETTTVGREPRAKRRTLANFRQLSLSMNNLSTVSADTAASPSTSFFITDDTDRAIFLHVRAPSEALKATWLEKIRKTSTDHQRLMNRFKDRGSLRSDTGVKAHCLRLCSI